MVVILKVHCLEEEFRRALAMKSEFWSIDSKKKSWAFSAYFREYRSNIRCLSLFDVLFFTNRKDKNINFCLAEAYDANVFDEKIVS